MAAQLLQAFTSLVRRADSLLANRWLTKLGNAYLAFAVLSFLLSRKWMFFVVVGILLLGATAFNALGQQWPGRHVLRGLVLLGFTVTAVVVGAYMAATAGASDGASSDAPPIVQGTTGTLPPSAVEPKETTKTLFVPATGTGLTGPIADWIQFKHGACTSRSYTDPNRANAFVCRTPDALWRHWGPCFPFSSPAEAEAGCFTTPWDRLVRNGVTYVLARATFLEVTYRRGVARRGDPDSWEKPWGLELPDGVRCLYWLGKRHKFKGAPDRTFYVCRRALPEALLGWHFRTFDTAFHLGQITWWESGELVGWILEEHPDQSEDLWTVHFARVDAPGEGTKDVIVLEAWK